MNTPVSDSAVQAPRLFSLSQRIGRLRYFVYTLVGMIGCAALLISIYLLALLLPLALGKLVSTIALILVSRLLIPLIVFILTMRRVRDFGLSGWWAFTILIPFVTLAYLFIPGAKSENRFGPQPAPNPPGLHFLAFALPIALIGLYYQTQGNKAYDAVSAKDNASDARSQSSAPGLKSY